MPTRIGQRRCKGLASSISTISRMATGCQASGLRLRRSTPPATVAVLGDTVRECSLAVSILVGQVMQVENIPFRVIGRPRTEGAVGLGTGPGRHYPHPLHHRAEEGLIWHSAIHSILAAAGSSARTATGYRASHCPAAPASPPAALAGKRFFYPASGSYGGRRGGEHARDDAPAGEYCLDLAAGGRHWHYEYYAGVGDRAHPRDRHPSRCWGKAERHPVAVSGRRR